MPFQTRTKDDANNFIGAIKMKVSVTERALPLVLSLSTQDSQSKDQKEDAVSEKAEKADETNKEEANNESSAESENGNEDD